MMQSTMEITAIAPARIGRAKSSYSVHLAPAEALCTLVTGPDLAPRSGDVVLATVGIVGADDRLELVDGRRATLFPGDEVIGVYGTCCVGDQNDAEVPDDLGPCELVTAGGLAGRTVSAHAKVGPPTVLVPVGLVADADGRRLNLADWRLPLVPPSRTRTRPTTLALVGTAGRSGMGSAAGALVQGIVRSGCRVGAAAVTGTGGGDVWLLADGGASPVVDVTHAGRPSTCRIGRDELVDVVQTLSGHVAAAGVDVMVLVFAQTAFEEEAVGLVTGVEAAGGVDGVVFAAADAMSACAGVTRLASAGLPVVAVAGSLGSSPLASREARDRLPHVPVLSADDLTNPLVAGQLIGACS